MMEAIGLGLEALGHAVSAIASWGGFVCIAGIAATTFLVYTDKISFDNVKDFFKKDKRYR